MLSYSAQTGPSSVLGMEDTEVTQAGSLSFMCPHFDGRDGRPISLMAEQYAVLGRARLVAEVRAPCWVCSQLLDHGVPRLL